MAKKNAEQEKPSFVLYTEHIEQFDSLSDAQAGQLIKAIMHYVAEEETYVEDPVVSTMMMFIRQTLDRDRKKWEETRAKRAEAGKKGGEETARRRKELEANAVFAEANQAVNVNDNVNVNENVNVNVNDNVNVNVNANENGNSENYYYYSSSKGTQGSTVDNSALIPYGREQHLTTKAEVDKIHALADELLYAYRGKKPTPDDYEKVFGYVHTIAVSEDGEHYGVYSAEKADLLRHVFEQAALHSDMNWQYINRIYINYEKNNVHNVEQAIAYESRWNRKEDTKPPKAEDEVTPCFGICL